MTNITLTKNKAMLYVVGIVAATLVISHLVQTYQSDLDETDEKQSNFSFGGKKWNFGFLFGIRRYNTNLKKRKPVKEVEVDETNVPKYSSSRILNDLL